MKPLYCAVRRLDEEGYVMHSYDGYVVSFLTNPHGSPQAVVCDLNGGLEVESLYEVIVKDIHGENQ